MKRARQTSLALLIALAIAGCDFLRGYAEGRSTGLAPYENEDLTTAQLGAARFLFDDFGALNTDTLDTSAVPWKLAAAALVLKNYPGQPATTEHLRALLTSYGFIFPAAVGNWPGDQPPEFMLPVGLVSGM